MDDGSKMCKFNYLKQLQFTKRYHKVNLDGLS